MILAQNWQKKQNPRDVAPLKSSAFQFGFVFHVTVLTLQAFFCIRELKELYTWVRIDRDLRFWGARRELPHPLSLGCKQSIGGESVD